MTIRIIQPPSFDSIIACNAILADKDGQVYSLQPGFNAVGRCPEYCLPWEDLRIDKFQTTLTRIEHASVSRMHAILFWNPQERRLSVMDRGSSNGTKVRGLRIGRDPVALKRGDTLHLGSYELVVAVPALSLNSSLTNQVGGKNV